MALEVMKLLADEINDDVTLCAINFINCDPAMARGFFVSQNLIKN